MPDPFAVETFPYGRLNWYPHMMPRDVKIWERFIDKYPEAFDTCEYDVPVGDAPEFDTVVSKETQGDVARLYQKKIDVVASNAGRLTIIELKPQAGASTIGQIKLYKRLYERDYSPPEKPTMLIITDAMKPDVMEFAKDEGVSVIIV